jgi:hypothetical protein
MTDAGELAANRASAMARSAFGAFIRFLSSACVCQAPDNVLLARINQHMGVVLPMPDKLDALYLRY